MNGDRQRDGPTKARCECRDPGSGGESCKAVTSLRCDLDGKAQSGSGQDKDLTSPPQGSTGSHFLENLVFTPVGIYYENAKDEFSSKRAAARVRWK